MKNDDAASERAGDSEEKEGRGRDTKRSEAEKGQEIAKRPFLLRRIPLTLHRARIAPSLSRPVFS